MGLTVRSKPEIMGWKCRKVSSQNEWPSKNKSETKRGRNEAGDKIKMI